jgi:hypothetical protein
LELGIHSSAIGGAEPARAERTAIAVAVRNGYTSLPSTIPMQPARRSWISTACFHAAKFTLFLNFGIAESEMIDLLSDIMKVLDVLK